MIETVLPIFIPHRSMRAFLCLAAAFSICLTGHGQDADSEDDKEVIVASKLEDAPERCRRLYQRLLKDIPEGARVRVTLGRFFDHGHSASTNRFEPYIAAVVPLDEKGQPHGEERFFEANGQMTSSVSYVHGVKDGLEKIYRQNPTGKTYLATENPWVRGEMEGIRKTYHEDGTVSSETPYKNGHAHGDAKSYDREGRLVRECSMRKGKQHGTLTDYWPETGQPRRVIQYETGEVQGVAREYYSTGQLKREIPFRKGSMHGEEKQYEGDGTLSRTVFWIEGSMVSKEEFREKF